MAIIYETNTREALLMKNLEQQIKNNQFTSKEQLNNYLIELQKKGLSRLTNEQTQSLLNLFDTIDKRNNVMNENLKQTSIEQQPTMISLSEITYIENVEKELLEKTKFLVTNSDIDFNDFSVDPDTQIFYDTKLNETYEVLKTSEDESKYHIVNISKGKTKKLIKPTSPSNMQNAAFTRVGFLVINILTFAILTIMIILLNKSK